MLQVSQETATAAGKATVSADVDTNVLLCWSDVTAEQSTTQPVKSDVVWCRPRGKLSHKK